MTAPAGVNPDWFVYYSAKRVPQQLLQVHLLRGLTVRRVLEVGPALGLVTAMLANAGYDVTTLDILDRQFRAPDVPHLKMDLLAFDPARAGGFDAILCCETLEHLPWAAVPGVLAGFRAAGARYLVTSVPYEAFQVFVQVYFNRWLFRRQSQIKKLRQFRAFVPESDPLGHKWEVGYRGTGLKEWEAVLRAAGWRIAARDFTSPCRSVFHLLERSTAAG